MEALISSHHQGTKKVSVTGAGLTYGNVKIQSLCGSWEKHGFVKVAVSRAAPLTRGSVTRVSTDCIVQFIIPGCYLWYWRSWCQGRWTYGWNEQVQYHIDKLYIYNIIYYHSVSFHVLHLLLVSCNDVTSYKCNIQPIIGCKIFNSDQNVLHFFSHSTWMELWSQNIPNLLLFIHWIHMGHGKPGKLCNLRISFSRPGKSWNLIFGHGKSWKI